MTETKKSAGTAKLIVGYCTRTIEPEALAKLTPRFEAARNLTDPKKIEADIAEKKAKFLDCAANMPYTGTFNRVVIADPQNEKIQQWDYKGREPGSEKPPICLAVAAWLLKMYPKAWSWDTHDTRKPEAVFVGFNPKNFLKMLGTECSLPQYNKPLPPRMWYANSDHRDIEEALYNHTDYKMLTLDVALQRRRPLEEKAAKKWDDMLAGWTGPHVDPVKDVWLATELAAQLGFLKG